MREYRKLPHGDERICTLGLGMGGIQNAPADEIRAVIEKAIANGINFFDLCAGGKSVYEPFGKAIAPAATGFSSGCTSGRYTTRTANTADPGICKPSGRPFCGNWKCSAPIMLTSDFCTASTRKATLTKSAKTES